MRLLVAKVTGSTGNTGHIGGVPAYVEIEHGDAGYFLIRYDANGGGLGDTWHADLDDAKRQAAFELEIAPEGWQPVQVE